MEPFEIQSGTDDRTPISRAEYFTVSVPRFIVYELISVGLWSLYWSYRNWDAINKVGYKKKISPLGRTIFHNLFLFSLLRNILNGAKRIGYAESYNPSSLAALLITLNISLRVMGKLQATTHAAALIVSVLSAVILILGPIVLSPAIKAIQYISVKQGRELQDNNKLTAGQIGLFFVGLLFWASAFWSK